MTTHTQKVGVFPGTFNPPTVAHVAVVTAARDRFQLDRVDLVVSRQPLAKESALRPSLEERVGVLEQLASRLGWIGVVVTEQQLIADIAAGYDLVIMGADKWTQIHDVQFYENSIIERDRAIARLPEVSVFPRSGDSVSSTRARKGEPHLMIPEAATFAAEHGVWGVGR